MSYTDSIAVRGAGVGVGGGSFGVGVGGSGGGGVPIAEVANGGTGGQSVDVPCALVDALGSGADEDERLIGRDVDPTIEGSAIGLPDDWQLRAPLKAKPSAVDGAVRTTRKAQLAAQRPRRNPVQDDAGTPRLKNAKSAKNAKATGGRDEGISAAHRE